MTTCPDRGRLEQLLDNLLADTELDELEQHVEGCGACQKTLDELTDATNREIDPAIGTSIARNAEEPGLDVDPTGRTLNATAADDERVGRGLPTVAGYEIEVELGRGGMGVVYKARHIRLNRTCALKMILAGAHASPQEANRFVTEAEAIARLEHPSIVQIHQIGDADGLPFLELEYISGGGLEQQLDGTPWPALRSARLVEEVSLGIAQAHRLGIVHRDLKPSNVLVTVDGAPKIGDFGLAKLLDSKSGLTRSESIMGSPSYMAPEQAEGRAKGAGPAVDVYAVGAILYELLTGRPPFRGTTALETLEQVKANEPVPPSRLVPAVPRDIETICLKCLQKEAGKRYQTAQALADDLRRFLEGRPIDARPISGAERAWRWCLRNRWIAGMTGVAAAAVSVGLAALLALVLFQQRANRTLQTSNLNLLAANTREQNARRLAQTRYALARRAVEVYYTGASEDVLLKQPELEDLRKRLLQTALEFYREMAATLTDSPDNTPETRDELAGAYSAVASIADQVGSKEDALAAFQKVRTILESLLHNKPGDEALRQRLADCLHHLANLSKLTGRRDEAARAYSEALALRERLVKDHPDDIVLVGETAGTLQSIGNFHVDDGRRDDAMRFYRQALKFYDDVDRLRPDDAANQNKRAGVIHDIGRLQGRTNWADGARTLEQVVEVRRRIVRDHPNDDGYQTALAASCNDLAANYWRMHRFDEALNRYQETLALWEDLVRRHPTINDMRERVANAHYNIGLVHSAAEHLQQAPQPFRTALAIQEALAKAYPTVVDYQLKLSKTYFQLGYLHRRLGHFDEAMSWYAKALALQEAVCSAQPGLTAAIESLAWTWNNLGFIQRMMGHTKEALESYSRCVQYRRKHIEREPTANAVKKELAWTYRLISDLKHVEGDTPGAVDAIQQAVAISESLVLELPNDDAEKRQLVDIQLARAALLILSGRASDAFDVARRVTSHIEDDYRRHPSEALARPNFAISFLVLGSAYLASGDTVAAQQSYNKARLFLESLSRLDQNELFYLARAYSLLSSCPAPGGPPPTPEGQAARQALADTAVANLRRAVVAGFRDWKWCHADPTLSALRSRDDYRALINDMAFPAYPFAH